MKNNIKFYVCLLLMPVLFLLNSFDVQAADVDLNSTYRLSPVSVRQTFEQTGWELRLTDNSVLNFFYGSDMGDTAGITIFEDKTIYLSDKGTYAQAALNHELGHFFDYVYGLMFDGMPSQSDDFAYIFSQEAYVDDYFQSYTVTSEEEYFAQCYKYYCENPKALTARPLTYSYMMSIIRNFDMLFERGFYIEDDLSILPHDATVAESTPVFASNKASNLSYSSKRKMVTPADTAY